MIKKIAPSLYEKTDPYDSKKTTKRMKAKSWTGKVKPTILQQVLVTTSCFNLLRLFSLQYASVLLSADNKLFAFLLLPK